jgi:hypothetical protein
MRKVFSYILLLSIIVTLSTCKKYPENTLWFKNPKKISPFYGHLKKYTVNGIDSLDLLNNYFGNQMGIVKDIRQARFDSYLEHGGYDCVLIVGGGASLSAGFKYYNNKNYINLFCGGDTSIFRKNLFLGEALWKILRLSKNAFKATTTLNNGNKYEIEIGS